MIDTCMWENEKFGSMPMGAQLLQIGMINHADDQGRVKAHPVYLSKLIFPYREDVSATDIQQWLELLKENETIILYMAEGKQYAQLANWWKYQNLQYAQPSQFPRPEGWRDRIRKTLTKGFIATCNWYTVDGSHLSDTCDQDGNPLPKIHRPSLNGDKPDSSTPSTHSPVHSGESTGESSGEGTIKDQSNLTKDQLNAREDLDPVVAEPPAVNAAPPAPPVQILRGSVPSKKPAVVVSSPYLRGAPFVPEGYIPPGQGSNPVQVYYERFCIRDDRARLTIPLEDDLVRCCPDLDRLRPVVEAYSRHLSYKPGNIQLIIDWYCAGGPPARPATHSPGRREFGILSKAKEPDYEQPDTSTVSPDEAAAIREWMRNVANQRAVALAEQQCRPIRPA